MTSSRRSRTTGGRARPMDYSRRRGGALLVAALVLLLAHAAFAGVSRSHRAPGRHSFNDRSPGATASVRWPAQGQAALLLGDRQPQASPDQRPAPIASLAKVMTAYLTLERYPLSGAQQGFTAAVTAEQAQPEGQGQSVVPVRAGEQLTERQLLEALLIPSGNNIARILAAQVAGSETGFVAEMNAEARALGMDHTTYTDPSGFDPGTVSTAADQLRAFRQAMRFPVFRQIVSMATVTLPVAGTLSNYNPLVTEGFAGKTGSDAAAGGCLAFFTHVTVAGRVQTAVGVVMGQGQGGETPALLAAAADAATQLVATLGRLGHGRTIAPAGPGGSRGNPQGPGPPLLSAAGPNPAPS